MALALNVNQAFPQEQFPVLENPAVQEAKYQTDLLCASQLRSPLGNKALRVLQLPQRTSSKQALIPFREPYAEYVYNLPDQKFP